MENSLVDVVKVILLKKKKARGRPKNIVKGNSLKRE